METQTLSTVAVSPKVVGLVKVQLPGMEWPQHVYVWNANPPYVGHAASASNVTGVRRGDHNEIRWTIRTLQRVCDKSGMTGTHWFYVVDRGDCWLLNVDHGQGSILYGVLLAERRRRAGRKGERAKAERVAARDERKRNRDRVGCGSRRTGEYYVE